MDHTWSDKQIDNDASLEEARAAAFDEMKLRGNATRKIRTATASVGVSFDDPAFKRSAMAEALFVRNNPQHTPSETARQYIGLSMVEMGKEILRSHSIYTTGLSPSGVIDRAMTTSDFPILLSDVMHKELRQSYLAAPSGIKQVARLSTSRDFRAKHKISLSGPLTLEQVNEHGEFKAGTYAESEEAYSLKTFGKIVAFSRQAIVNDSLGGLSDPARMLGRACAEFEASSLVSLYDFSHNNRHGKPVCGKSDIDC
ncbi:MAG: hypothetical protein EB015_21195 [Methylocystaceae bacterium]|nr:hypothetical protein [Methylocystaceae bacterium]